MLDFRGKRGFRRDPVSFVWTRRTGEHSSAVPLKGRETVMVTVQYKRFEKKIED